MNYNNNECEKCKGGTLQELSRTSKNRCVVCKINFCEKCKEVKCCEKPFIVRRMSRMNELVPKRVKIESMDIEIPK